MAKKKAQGKGAVSAAPSPGPAPVVLDWTLHQDSLRRWASTPRSRREGIGLPLGQSCVEQGDACARAYFTNHDLDALLAGDEVAAFVAYSVSELLVLVADSTMWRAEMEGAYGNLSSTQIAALRETTRATLVGAAQRITWHALYHAAGVRVEEPLGPAIDPADLPPLVTGEVAP